MKGTQVQVPAPSNCSHPSVIPFSQHLAPSSDLGHTGTHIVPIHTRRQSTHTLKFFFKKNLFKRENQGINKLQGKTYAVVSGYKKGIWPNSTSIHNLEKKISKPETDGACLTGHDCPENQLLS